MKKSVSKRIRITSRGKMMRRATALGHCRGNKSGVQRRRKQKNRGLNIHIQTVRKHLH